MKLRFDAPMEMPGKFPEEMPNKEETLGSEVGFRVSKALEVPAKNSGDGGTPDIMVNVKKLPDITVSLSGKRNLKLVTNWMRKHMEAYPETFQGFFVRFIDDDQAKGYLVLPCDGNEKGEMINGVNYEILPYVFESNSEKINGVTETTKREMLGMFEREGVNRDNGRDVDETERMNKNKE